MADKVATFEEYARSLEVRCEAGRPATLQWTVQPDTPDTVYYQVRLTGDSVGLIPSAVGNIVGAKPSREMHCQGQRPLCCTDRT